jgi:DNA helicase-2/ATP-dependent DNA helicase PcrA
MQRALQERGVPAIIAQRRDDFLSAEFRWLVASFRQIARPLDRRNLATMVGAFNRMATSEVAVDQVIADAEATGRSYFSTWLGAASATDSAASHTDLLSLLDPVVNDPSAARATLDQAVAWLAAHATNPEAESDLAEDLAAWRELTRDIAGHIGKSAPLDQFLQELQLRSKEPSPRPNTVTLSTIHGAKGREFDCVHLIGLAEDVMPSFQSRQRGDQSPEMEEERRNCFVAITRTKECLILSWAASYRGWRKGPSRFLAEMELIDIGSA